MITPRQSFRLQDLPGSLRSCKQGFWHYDYPHAPKWHAYRELATRVDELKSIFERGGLRPGDRLGLQGSNSPEWIAADLAALAAGLITVPFPDNMGIADLEQAVDTYGLQAVLFTDAQAEPPARPWIARSRDGSGLSRRAAPADALDEGATTLVFSSGTAGTRKCLAILAAGIEQTIRVMTEGWHIDGRDNLLVALPLSGLQQRILVYTAILADCQFALAAPSYLLKVMRQANPTIVVGPPSFYEPLEARWKAMPENVRELALQAIQQGGDAADALPGAVRDLLETFGSKPRHLVVGSAPVRPTLLQTYRHLGLPLYEVYGITEFGWVSFNTPGSFRDGSVGRVVPGVRVELQADGEITLHGEQPQCRRYVVSGESEQHSTFLGNGGIATGDLGTFDADGFLRLTGRKKNVIISRSGYKISPEEMESWLEQHIDCVRCMVLLPEHAHSLHAIVWVTQPSQELAAATSRKVLDLARTRPSTERIVQVLVRDARELSSELGTLTQNLKLNRQGVMRHLASLPSAAAAAAATGDAHARQTA